jgi:hypothetical protein
LQSQENKTNAPEVYLVVGESGTGKTTYIVKQIDLKQPVFAIDFRGQLAEKFDREIFVSRKEVKEELKKSVPFVLYQPGMDDFPVEDDIDFFLTLAYCMSDSQIIIDEMDFELKPTEYPASFRKLIASARTQNLTIYVSAHRLKEVPVKMRALGKKIVFRLTEQGDLDYLRGISGFDADEISHLSDYHFVILPKKYDPTRADN